ncbi:hypothetical protein CYMTET_30289, partial [Cymbomonas tetramitiformis]
AKGSASKNWSKVKTGINNKIKTKTKSKGSKFEEAVKGAISQDETENPLATLDSTDPRRKDVTLPAMSDPAVTGGDLAHGMSVDLAPAAESPSKKAAVIPAGATYKVTAVFEESLVWHLAVHLTDRFFQEHATQRAEKQQGKCLKSIPSISRRSNPVQSNSTLPVPVRYVDGEDEENGENNGDGKDENRLMPEPVNSPSHVDDVTPSDLHSSAVASAGTHSSILPRTDESEHSISEIEYVVPDAQERPPDMGVLHEQRFSSTFSINEMLKDIRRSRMTARPCFTLGHERDGRPPMIHA